MFGYDFNHIGIACENVEATAAFVKTAFDVVSDSGTIQHPMENVTAARLFNEGRPSAIELVSGPSVAGLLQKNTTYFHIGYSVADIELAVKRAASIGSTEVMSPTPSALFGGRRVAFVYTPLGLIEFVEKS